MLYLNSRYQTLSNGLSDFLNTVLLPYKDYPYKDFFILRTGSYKDHLFKHGSGHYRDERL